MFCMQCGTPLPPTARFCMDCGEAVEQHDDLLVDAAMVPPALPTPYLPPDARRDAPVDGAWTPTSPPIMVRQQVQLLLQVPSASSDCGALMVYVGPTWRGWSVQLGARPFIGESTPEFVANVVERVIGGQQLYAAVFPRVPGREYRVQGCGHSCYVSVFAGEVAEVDWR